VINEEWEHRLYAERDLTILEAREPGSGVSQMARSFSSIL